MRTDTLKQIIASIIVGLLFAVPLNISTYMKKGPGETIGQFLYMFSILAATYFLTGMINNRRGRKTSNMRIFAKKMRNEGILKLDASSDILEIGERPKRGWLYLTDTFVIFAGNPDPELIEKKSVKIPLSKISKVERFKPTFLTNDGIRIKLQKGQQYEVCVGNTQTWIDSIIEGANKKQNKKQNKKHKS